MNTKQGAIIIEGHVQGLSNTRSLGEIGIPVYVLDKTNCIARYSKYCKKFFRCPDFISEEFIEFLIDLANKEKIQDWVLIPSNDHAVYNISNNKKVLEKYYKIITPTIDIIGTIYDKANLLSLAQKCNVPIPRTQYFKSADESISNTLIFPLLTKGRNGLSFYKTFGKKVFLANNEQEFRVQLKYIADKYSLENTFTQEFIPFNNTNKTISFTAFVDDGQIKSYWIGEKVREHPIQFGTATFARSILCADLYEPSQRLLNELKYSGVCEIEYLLDLRDNKYKLIEINARTWLWVGLAKACGVDYAKMIYRYVNNIENIYPLEYVTELYWINNLTDSIYSLISIFKLKLNVKTYVKSLKFRKVTAVYDKKDLLPAFMFLILIFNIFLKRR